jgi:DNA-binding MarR family transcriptional regulator
LRYFAQASARARTVSGLAHYQGTTLAPASRTLAALVRKGFLVAVVDPNDRRSRTMELTPAAHELLENDPLHRIAGILEQLDETQRQYFAQALETFLEGAAALEGRTRPSESDRGDAETPVSGPAPGGSSPVNAPGSAPGSAAGSDGAGEASSDEADGRPAFAQAR